MCCGSTKARCAVQAGIIPFEFGTSPLGLTKRHWYVNRLCFPRFFFFFFFFYLLEDITCFDLGRELHVIVLLFFRMVPKYFATFPTLLYQDYSFLEAQTDMFDSGIPEQLVSQCKGKGRSRVLL